MKIHTTFLLLLFALSLHAQKYLVLYEHQEYQKSLEACKKVIEKDKTNLEAYLYKSLNTLQLAIPPQIEKINPYGIEQSLSTLQFLQTKKGGSAFLQEHRQEYDLIAKTAFSAAEQFFLADDIKLSERLVNDLFKIDSLPEYYYLSGRIKYAAEEFTEGISDMNTAASMIYRNYKKGKIAAPYLPQLFIDLARGIYTDNDKQSAYVVFYRAVTMFKTDSMAHAFFQLMTYDADSLYTAGDPEKNAILYQYTDSLNAFMADKNLIKELQWKYITKFFYNAYDYEEWDNASGILQKYCCNDPLFFMQSAGLLNIIIQKNTSIQFIYGKDSVTMKKELVNIAASFAGCSGKDIGIYFNQVIGDSIAAGNVLAAAKLLYNFKPFIKDKKMLTATQQQIVSSSMQLYARDSNYAACRDIAALLNDKGLYAALSDQSMKVVEKYIAENKFSQAGRIIRSNIEKYPKSEQWQYIYKKWVLADYEQNYRGSDIDGLKFSEPYSADACKPGKLSAETQKLFLQRINYVRRLAGINDHCKLNDSLNAFAQAAALMMEANYDLSHMPPKDWKCFSAQGAHGASHSNLSLGYHGVDALMGQMEDSGGNNGSVGHRRWILNPYNTVFGHGSTASAMALYVFGTDGYNDSLYENFRTKYICWPPKGYSPAPFNCVRWSFSLDATDFSKATVEVTNNNKKIALEILPVDVGYGINTLVWEMQGLPYSFSSETTYVVTIKNVTGYSDTEPKTYTYSVTFLPVAEYSY